MTVTLAQLRRDYEKEENEKNSFNANFCVLDRRGLWRSNDAEHN